MLNVVSRFAAVLLFLFSTIIQAQAIETEPVRTAIANLKTLAGWPVEEAVSPLLDQYDAADFSQYNDKDLSLYVFNELNMHKWGNTITEFTDLITLIFSFQDADYQAANQPAFDESLGIVNFFRNDINKVVQDNHPGFNIKHKKLTKHFTGKGIKVAVFDVFDATIYHKQNLQYAQATFEPIHSFGDPVSLNHGNSVVDVLLQIAPEITIVPVAAESSTYIDAMNYLLSREDIHIINMSRAFAEKDGTIDPEFSTILQQLLSNKIVTKSLGNTGTDLDGNLSPIRVSQNLPPVGNLFSYDLALIQTFLNDTPSHDRSSLQFAINMESFSEQVSLTATIPGGNTQAIEQSFAIPADAVFSWSTGNFESGSSFAAPQLAAVSALLWEACLNKGCAEASRIAFQISQTLRFTTRPTCLTQEEVGLGLVHGKRALNQLNR